MQTAVVTGASRGIGYAVARELAARGYRVVLLARDRAGLERARSTMSGDTAVVVGDLSTVKGTRGAADSLLTTCAQVDVLVHNAGLWPAKLERDASGIERAFAVNHLAPFALNHWLAPVLGRGARIVQVSAGLYALCRPDPVRTARGDDFHPIFTYARTKACNLMLLAPFAARFAASGVTINAVHPGVIRTDLGNRPGILGLLLRGVKRFWKPIEEGARPVVRLATDRSLAGVTGRFFLIERETALAPFARDGALVERLWEQASALCGL